MDKPEGIINIGCKRQEGLNYDYAFADCVSSAQKIIASGSFDIILSDFMLGDGTALDVLPEVHDIPIIVVTGTGNEETAVKAMKMGASDYLIKDPDGFFLKTLPLTVMNAISRRKAETELKRYRESLEQLVNERTKKLRESEEHYRTLITRMINAFALQEIICDENNVPCDFRFLEVNAAFEEISKNGDKYDLVISDMTMPEMSGLELAKKILEADPCKPVIICSGYSDQINNETASDMGVCFIQKPVIMSELTKMIRELMDKPASPPETKGR